MFANGINGLGRLEPLLVLSDDGAVLLRGGGMMVVRTLHYKLAYTVSTVCPQRLFQFNLYMFTMLQ